MPQRLTGVKKYTNHITSIAIVSGAIQSMREGVLLSSILDD
jgi:hypothetical protein